MAALVEAKNDAKRIVQIAKRWLSEQYADEEIHDIGLEEVRLSKGCWEITLGFGRKKPRSENSILPISILYPLDRIFKVITISDKTGEIISMRNRDLD
jgi:hypothetical protein